MIVATTLETFPNCPSYGFSSQPDYLTKKVMREGGQERRDRKWANPLHRYNGTPMGPRPQEDIERILNFWHAMGGEFEAFRFRDYVDYKSCALAAEPAAIDQPITPGPGSPAGYQLTKRYTVGSRVQERPIYRPDGATIRIANELGVEQAANRFTVYEDTGLITPNGLFVGTPTFWGGLFYVKVRFDGPFAPEIVDQKIQSLTVSLCELRENE